jgi:hypothetical protein
MKYRTMLVITVLSIGVLGCSGDKKVEDFPPQTEPVLPPQNLETQSTSWEADIDVSRLPRIITSVYKKLDITLKQQDRKTGRYVFTGISPSGFHVTVEAVSIIKNLSLIRVSVSRRQEDIIIAKLLLQNVSDALRKGIGSRN